MITHTIRCYRNGAVDMKAMQHLTIGDIFTDFYPHIQDYPPCAKYWLLNTGSDTVRIEHDSNGEYGEWGAVELETIETTQNKKGEITTSVLNKRMLGFYITNDL